MKYLIVGLGNIGPEYHETRHNIGFMVVDNLAKAAGATCKDGRYGFTTTLSIKGRQLLLLKPSTYMNLSGNAVRYWMQKENIGIENLLIVVDDFGHPIRKDDALIALTTTIYIVFLINAELLVVTILLLKILHHVYLITNQPLGQYGKGAGR